MTFANVLPRQLATIPWGWENTSLQDPLCGTATYVSKPLGRIEVPPLEAYFDWSSFIIEGEPAGPLGTRNMKSIFTTAARFLGYEEMLITQPDLFPIRKAFYHWNLKLLMAWVGKLSVFTLGDDIAGNGGLFMSPSLFRSWILPEQCWLLSLARSFGLQTIWHSDGDIYDILEDLLACPLIDTINFEPVGRMERFKDWPSLRGKRLELVHDQTQRHENSMRLQRQEVSS